MRWRMPGGSGLLRYGYYGEQRNQGLEFSLDGELSRGLRVIAGASLIDATLTRTAGGVNQGDHRARRSGLPRQRQRRVGPALRARA